MVEVRDAGVVLARRAARCRSGHQVAMRFAKRDVAPGPEVLKVESQSQRCACDAGFFIPQSPSSLRLIRDCIHLAGLVFQMLGAFCNGQTSTDSGVRQTP